MGQTQPRDIICAECPNVYAETQISAHRGDESRPLVEVLGRTETASGRKPGRAARTYSRLFSRERASGDDAAKFSIEAQKDKLINLDRLKDWEFRCPDGHIVDGNRGQQLPIAVVGPSGASKSHFLPGLVWETGLLRALGPVGVTLRTGQFTSSILQYAMTQVYEHRQVLPPTPPDKVTGPFGYRLSIQRDSTESRHSLLLFDVGGEALSTIVNISEQAAFVLLCQAIFVLIDPQDLMPTRFDAPDKVMSDRQRVIAAARVRDGITRIADALEELWDGPMRNIPVPVCFVIAKADSVDWIYEWDRETSTVINSVAGGSNLHDLLVQSSERTRAQFAEFGGQLIVDEIAERFNQEKVRFAAASATSEMPTFQAHDGNGSDKGRWQEPTPEGISLALLQLLDMLGRVGRPEVTPDQAQAIP